MSKIEQPMQYPRYHRRVVVLAGTETLCTQGKISFVSEERKTPCEQALYSEADGHDEGELPRGPSAVPQAAGIWILMFLISHIHGETLIRETLVRKGTITPCDLRSPPVCRQDLWAGSTAVMFSCTNRLSSPKTGQNFSFCYVFSFGPVFKVFSHNSLEFFAFFPKFYPFPDEYRPCMRRYSYGSRILFTSDKGIRYNTSWHHGRARAEYKEKRGCSRHRACGVSVRDE